MDEKIIDKLETRGFKRWTKGDYDRLYIDATSMGLELSYYKTGNICYAEWKGERISNSRGYKFKTAKTYVDIKTGKVHSDRDDLKESAEEILNEVLKEEI